MIMINSKAEQNIKLASDSKTLDTKVIRNQTIIKKAEPFANALFEVALETIDDKKIILYVNGLLSKNISLDSRLEFFEMYNDAEEMVNILVETPEIFDFLQNPFIFADRKKSRFIEFFPNINKKIQNLAFLLIDNSKTNLIIEVFSQFCQKYCNYFEVRQLHIDMGPLGNASEANFISYQFSEILKNLELYPTGSKLEFYPKLQISNTFSTSKSTLGGFSLTFSKGTGFLDFSVGSEFKKFFSRIILKS